MLRQPGTICHEWWATISPWQCNCLLRSLFVSDFWWKHYSICKNVCCFCVTFSVPWTEQNLQSQHVMILEQVKYNTVMQLSTNFTNWVWTCVHCLQEWWNKGLCATKGTFLIIHCTVKAKSEICLPLYPSSGPSCVLWFYHLELLVSSLMISQACIVTVPASCNNNRITHSRYPIQNYNFTYMNTSLQHYTQNTASK